MLWSRPDGASPGFDVAPLPITDELLREYTTSAHKKEFVRQSYMRLTRTEPLRGRSTWGGFGGARASAEATSSSSPEVRPVASRKVIIHSSIVDKNRTLALKLQTIDDTKRKGVIRRSWRSHGECVEDDQEVEYDEEDQEEPDTDGADEEDEDEDEDDEEVADEEEEEEQRDAEDEVDEDDEAEKDAQEEEEEEEEEAEEEEEPDVDDEDDDLLSSTESNAEDREDADADADADDDDADDTGAFSD
jgi:hypothetical protein